MAFTVEFTTNARKSLRAIKDARLRTRIVSALEALAQDPRPSGAKRLVGQNGALRIRVRDWRIVYRVEEGRLVVLVLAVAPRGEVYKGQVI